MCQWDWGDSFHCLAVSSFEVSSTLSPLCAVWTGSRFPQLRCHSCPKDTWNCGLTKLLQHPGFCFSYYPQPSSGYFQDSTGGEKCRSCSLGDNSIQCNLTTCLGPAYSTITCSSLLPGGDQPTLWALLPFFLECSRQTPGGLIIQSQNWLYYPFAWTWCLLWTNCGQHRNPTTSCDPDPTRGRLPLTMKLLG